MDGGRWRGMERDQHREKERDISLASLPRLLQWTEQIAFIIKSVQIKKLPGLYVFIAEFYRTFKEAV